MSLIDTERDQAAQARWQQAVQPTHDPVTTVFGDETWTNTTMTRRYGRARRGQRVVDRVPRNHGSNVTLLAALGTQGGVASLTVTGAVDRPVLNDGDGHGPPWHHAGNGAPVIPHGGSRSPSRPLCIPFSGTEPAPRHPCAVLPHSPGLVRQAVASRFGAVASQASVRTTRSWSGSISSRRSRT